MKSALLSIFLALPLLAQGERAQPQQKAPSSMMTAVLPAQTITLTISLSSEQATQLEKRRIDQTHPVTNADGTVSMVTAPTLADQMGFDIQRTILTGLARAYPAPSMQAAQAAAAKAQADLTAAQQKAAEAQIKSVPAK